MAINDLHKLIFVSYTSFFTIALLPPFKVFSNLFLQIHLRMLLAIFLPVSITIVITTLIQVFAKFVKVFLGLLVTLDIEMPSKGVSVPLESYSFWIGFQSGLF